MTRSIVLAALVSLGLLTSVGCAATTDSSDDDIAESDDALTSSALSLAGRYYDAQVPFAGIGRLSLGTDGKYTAHVEAGGRAVCIASPCLLPETGTWNASKRANGTFRLRLRATGAASRYYETNKANGVLTLKRAGTTQTLTSLDSSQCLDDTDCSAEQECGPKLCMMICLAGDPFCCGPSTCQPKEPAPAPSCDGAWLDQNGTCRTPADGVYPDACCAGPKCGDAQCAEGFVCCNALAGICTPPGMVCTQ
jgi:hypothetical protein